jgi:pyruvate,orthophosphate dikinase
MLPLTATTLDATAPDKALHGGKGAGLIAMAAAGLPVPQALVITTAAWKSYRETGDIPHQVRADVAAFIAAYPGSMFSVRSGAPVSMPGMMDTVLNVGVTPELDALYPGAFRRFATSWLGIVKSVGPDRIKTLVSLVSDRAGSDGARFFSLLSGVVQTSEQVSIPSGRLDQVMACVEAVFRSWDTPRAKVYRAMHNIPEDMGTACVVQRMVMGTASGLSGSGVMFTRDPATGAAQMRGEIAFNAQGEEVVAGEVTPHSLSELPFGPPVHKTLYASLSALCYKLEAHFGDVQDIEFTIESGNLYVLQTRTAKMSARARIETACALAKVNHPKDAKARLDYIRARVTRGMVAQTMVPVVATDAAFDASGLAASPGAIAGRVVFRTTPMSKVGKDCILVAEDTAPEDFPVMAKSGGILTAAGGFTCHSAVVARGIGVPAVVGCGELTFTKGKAVLNGKSLSEGDMITIDGTTGQVYVGAFEVKKSQPPRSIYAALDAIIQERGTPVPPHVHYYDCGIGKRVVLPINPADPARIEAQLGRAQRLKAKGKEVAFAFEMQGLGEDMFDLSPDILFKALADDYAPDFAGFTILYGVPKAMAPTVEKLLGVKVNTTEAIAVIDLLDLIG